MKADPTACVFGANKRPGLSETGEVIKNREVTRVQDMCRPAETQGTSN